MSKLKPQGQLVAGLIQDAFMFQSKTVSINKARRYFSLQILRQEMLAAEKF